MNDDVNHPEHYERLGEVQCIDITEEFNFCLGNVIKYVWRAGYKKDTPDIKDLRKAQWYLAREIQRRESEDKV